MNSNILIIDDDIELTDLLTQYLEPEGFNVVCVHDGEDGVKKALNQSFDAIVLDVMLPKLNGFEVLKAIREHLETPVLMLTAPYSDLQVDVDARGGCQVIAELPLDLLRRVRRRQGVASTDVRRCRQVRCAPRGWRGIAGEPERVVARPRRIVVGERVVRVAQQQLQPARVAVDRVHIQPVHIVVDRLKEVQTARCW